MLNPYVINEMARIKQAEILRQAEMDHLLSSMRRANGNQHRSVLGKVLRSLHLLRLPEVNSDPPCFEAGCA